MNCLPPLSDNEKNNCFNDVHTRTRSFKNERYSAQDLDVSARSFLAISKL